jgi:hypothetical protein
VQRTPAGRSCAPASPTIWTAIEDIALWSWFDAEREVNALGWHTADQLIKRLRRSIANR